MPEFNHFSMYGHLDCFQYLQLQCWNDRPTNLLIFFLFFFFFLLFLQDRLLDMRLWSQKVRAYGFVKCGQSPLQKGMLHSISPPPFLLLFFFILFSKRWTFPLVPHLLTSSQNLLCKFRFFIFRSLGWRKLSFLGSGV